MRERPPISMSFGDVGGRACSVHDWTPADGSGWRECKVATCRILHFDSEECSTIALSKRLRELEAQVASAVVESERPWKYVISHPSDRVLCRDHAGNEVWGFNDSIPFDTEAEARARIDERAKQYPNGDWPQARVRMFRPGRRIPDEWKELP